MVVELMKWLNTEKRCDFDPEAHYVSNGFVAKVSQYGFKLTLNRGHAGLELFNDSVMYQLSVGKGNGACESLKEYTIFKLKIP